MNLNAAADILLYSSDERITEELTIGNLESLYVIFMGGPSGVVELEDRIRRVKLGALVWKSRSIGKDIVDLVSDVEDRHQYELLMLLGTSKLSHSDLDKIATKVFNVPLRSGTKQSKLSQLTNMVYQREHWKSMSDAFANKGRTSSRNMLEF
jgi:hypothetical protein